MPRKPKSPAPLQPPDLVKMAVDLSRDEAALRAKLEGIMQRNPDAFLPLYLDLVDGMLRKIRVSVDTLAWFQDAVRDSLAKAAP